MVLISAVRQMATKRIPLIKFRRQREEATQHANTGNLQQANVSSSSPAAAKILPTIEDWQLPQRYRRKPLDPIEIEYINRGA